MCCVTSNGIGCCFSQPFDRESTYALYHQNQAYQSAYRAGSFSAGNGIGQLLAKDELYNQAEERLLAVREIKERQLDAMFANFSNNLDAIAAVIQNSESLNSLSQSRPMLEALNKELGFYDIFIIEDSGLVKDTVTHEADWGSNLRTGPYADSGLGRLFRSAINSNGATVMADFSLMPPRAMKRQPLSARAFNIRAAPWWLPPSSPSTGSMG